MKLTVNRLDLLRILKITNYAIDKKGENALYHSTLLETVVGDQDGQSYLRASATNGHVAIHAHVPAQVQDHGAVLIEGGKMATVMSKASSGVAKLSISSTHNQLNYTAGAVRGRMVIQDATNYPRRQPVPWIDFKVNADQFVRAIKRVVISAADGNTGRPVLEGLDIAITANNQMVLSSGDGNRMSRERLGVKIDHLKLEDIPNMVIHRRMMAILSNLILQTPDYDKLDVSVLVPDGNLAKRAMFMTEGWVMETAVVSHPFPQVDLSSLEGGAKTRLYFRTDQIQDCLDQALVFASDAGNVGALNVATKGEDYVYNMEPAKCVLLAESSESGSSAIEIPVVVWGAGSYMTLNLKYLLQAVRVFYKNAPMISVEISSPSSPMLIKPHYGNLFLQDEKVEVPLDKQADFLHVLMGMAHKEIAADLQESQSQIAL